MNTKIAMVSKQGNVLSINIKHPPRHLLDTLNEYFHSNATVKRLVNKGDLQTVNNYFTTEDVTGDTTLKTKTIKTLFEAYNADKVYVWNGEEWNVSE